MTTSVNLAEAKATLSALVARVERGETVHIMRRGRPVAKVCPLDDARKPTGFTPEVMAELRAIRAKMPQTDVVAGESVRAMRAENRY